MRYPFHDTYVYCPECKLTWTMSRNGAKKGKKRYYGRSETKMPGLMSEVCPKCKGELIDELNKVIK